MVILPWPMMATILASLADVLSDKIPAEILGAAILLGMDLGASRLPAFAAAAIAVVAGLSCASRRRFMPRSLNERT